MPNSKGRYAAKFFAALLFVSLPLFTSCGGSSGDDDPRNVSGLWTGFFTKLEDTCPGSAAPQTVSFSHRVNQNNEAVTLLDSNSAEYLGNIVGGDGFSADNTSSASFSGAQCTLSNRIEYNEIADDDDPGATVEFGITRQCPNGTTCVTRYAGSATRAVAAATAVPGATATVASSTTPIAGGCPAMNPNPAAGTYGGDGGCGISDARFSVTTQGASSVVLLNPFGANGATSFTIDSANPSSATSVRSDLTINGDDGYSCSMVCSPPGTFTISCFKEGGTTCTEKF